MKDDSELLKQIIDYYEKKVIEYGPVPAGVDWNSKKTQTLRFQKLTQIINEEDYFTLNDFGCGYGALHDHISENKKNFDYFGFDISNTMICHAKKLHLLHSHCHYTTDINALPRSDYTIASGIFNVKLSISNTGWRHYILSILNFINKVSQKGFSFNCLTSYSDKHMMKDYLYYANPEFFFNYCKKNYSKNVSLLHDYDLYEFTILVKK